MIRLELTEEEHFTLTHILRDYLSDLRMEIVDTDSTQFKQMLRDRKRVVMQVLDKLEQALQESQAGKPA
ncbi:MAG TPA: hypothetical protein VNJ09_05060 [Chthonomonadales bacterium]|nr:hypothetical protein [Chthonomonadales bacterium]